MPDHVPEPPKKGTTKPRARRRNFAAELADLQTRVKMAIKLLTKVGELAPGAELVAVALETLKGE